MSEHENIDPITKAREAVRASSKNVKRMREKIAQLENELKERQKQSESRDSSTVQKVKSEVENKEGEGLNWADDKPPQQHKNNQKRNKIKGPGEGHPPAKETLPTEECGGKQNRKKREHKTELKENESTDSDVEVQISKRELKKMVKTISQQRKRKTDNKVAQRAFRDLDKESSRDSSSGSEESGRSDDELSNNTGSDDDSSGEQSSDPDSDSESEHEERKKKGNSGGSDSGYKALWPSPPERYFGDYREEEGMACLMKYFQFLTQSWHYLKRGKVPNKDWVLVAAESLRGDAYRFYMNEVSWKARKWSYCKFMKALFNACFPATFRMRQQRKLDTLEQGEQLVRQFAFEMTLLFKCTGYVHKRERVQKLCQALQPRLQEWLLEGGYDPEKTKWSEVVDAAELYKIARTIRMEAARGNQKDNLPKVAEARKAYEERRNGPKQRIPSNVNPLGHGRHTSEKTTDSWRPAEGRPRQRVNKRRGNPKSLTEEERGRYLKEGRCFKCGVEGHITKHCPKGGSITSLSSGPPGIQSNKIGFDLAETK
ncbi:hypothetical protein C0991_011530 [Blastosporella zonata]|nr:hypothetical protein C0991_011530 [Blastosporella zonata]